MHLAFIGPIGFEELTTLLALLVPVAVLAWLVVTVLSLRRTRTSLLHRIEALERQARSTSP